MSVARSSAMGFRLPNGNALYLVLVPVQGNMYMGAQKNTAKLWRCEAWKPSCDNKYTVSSQLQEYLSAWTGPLLAT